MSQKKKGGGRPVLGPLVAADEVRAPTTAARELADSLSDALLRKTPAQLTEEEISLLSLALSGPHGNEIMARRKRLS